MHNGDFEPRYGDTLSGESFDLAQQEIYHQFLWPESCPVSSHTNQELSCKARLETALSRVRHTGSFDPGADAVTPEGFGCYCADQNAIAFPGGTTPPKGPARRTSRARNGSARAGRERT